MIQDYLRITVKNLAHRKIRSWLTILGVIIGIAAIVSLALVSQGLQNSVEEQFSKLGVENIRVIPGGLTGPPTGSKALDRDVVDMVERARGVDYVTPVLINYETVEAGTEKQTISVQGQDLSVTEKGFLDIDVDLIEGRFLEPGERKSALLGYNVAKDEDVFRKEIRAKNNIKIGEVTFKVAGIFEKLGNELDDRITISIEDSREMHPEQDEEVHAMTATADDGLDIATVASNIERELLKDLDEDEFAVFTPEQLLSQINAVLGIIQVVLVGIAAISLLVGGIGIMNAMFTSVLERTREIGVMKAIGAQRKDILFMFLIESALVGLVGGLAGAILGVAISYLVGFGAAQAGFNMLVIKFDVSVFLIGLLFAVGTGVLSGLVPAWRASRLQPVDALRYE